MLFAARMAALHHLALRTQQVQALVAFYREWLGLEVVRDFSPRSVWLKLDHQAVLMIEQAEAHELPPNPGSLELCAFRVSAHERVRLRELLVARGMLEAETEHTLYLRDPDGRRVGVSSYPLSGDE